MAKKSQKFDPKAALVGAVLAALLTSLFWYAAMNNQASLFNTGPKLKMQPVNTELQMEPVMQDSFSDATGDSFSDATGDSFSDATGDSFSDATGDSLR